DNLAGEGAGKKVADNAATGGDLTGTNDDSKAGEDITNNMTNSGEADDNSTGKNTINDDLAGVGTTGDNVAGVGTTIAIIGKIVAGSSMAGDDMTSKVDELLDAA